MLYRIFLHPSSLGFALKGADEFPRRFKKVFSQPSNCLGNGHYRNGLPIGGLRPAMDAEKGVIPPAASVLT